MNLRLNLRQILPALLCAALIAATLAACGPLGDDDDDDAGNDNAAGGAPTATREVVMATFTATEVVPPAGQTATAEAQATAAEATREARGSLPTPTPALTVEEETILYPPRTRLQTPNQLTEGYLSTYSWQFNDEAQTYSAIEAPITVLEQGDPVQVDNGDQLAIVYYGEEYRSPPQQLEVAVYDFETNSAIPTSGQAEADEPAFAIRTDPVQTLRVDPNDPSFAIEGFTPGHYIIWVQGRWGQHPLLDRPIFVTWVYDIEIPE